MILDHRYHQLDQFRSQLCFVIYPLQWVVNGTIQSYNTLTEYCVSHHQLVKKNLELQKEVHIQNARLQKLLALESENARLRTLLQSTPRAGEKLLVAEIIQVDSDPLSHQVVIDKGSNGGAYQGQPVLDAEGIMGEIIEVFPDSSRVLLLTDANHGIPVEDLRNGVRGIVMGTGEIKTLSLNHVPNTMDLKIGDVLITSGLGGRYPAGYPVGVISEISKDASETFAKVSVMPTAQLERTRQVLLIQKETNINLEKSIDEDTETKEVETKEVERKEVERKTKEANTEIKEVNIETKKVKTENNTGSE